MCVSEAFLSQVGVGDADLCRLYLSGRGLEDGESPVAEVWASRRRRLDRAVVFEAEGGAVAVFGRFGLPKRAGALLARTRADHLVLVGMTNTYGIGGALKSISELCISDDGRDVRSPTSHECRLLIYDLSEIGATPTARIIAALQDHANLPGSDASAAQREATVLS
jgi:hypothetical protein